ncbi:hypothetical protein Z051_26840 [Rhodococcus rhodochrous KG-21]|uniref:Uncharacterized protein n=1 Tax=Rhodococcus rhodochrous KG-21 TaxID=1441923 RepID=A0A0N0S086_RHORH|nr:hypothetical protein Z051_26840 [Rhodococcus rhodochrous KG-21]
MPGHRIGVRLVQAQQIPADGRIQFGRFDVFGKIRLVRTRVATRSRSTFATPARAETAFAAAATRGAAVPTLGSVTGAGRACAPIVPGPVVPALTGATIVGAAIVVRGPMPALGAESVVTTFTVGAVRPVSRRAVTATSLRTAAASGIVPVPSCALVSTLPTESAVVAATVRPARRSLSALLSPVGALAMLATVSAS